MFRTPNNLYLELEKACHLLELLSLKELLGGRNLLINLGDHQSTKVRWILMLLKLKKTPSWLLLKDKLKDKKEGSECKDLDLRKKAKSLKITLIWMNQKTPIANLETKTNFLIPLIFKRKNNFKLPRENLCGLTEMIRLPKAY